MSTVGKTFYDLIDSYVVEIPALQRDYAQGRIGQVEIRTSFLSYLKEILDSNKLEKLDFIYGVVGKRLEDNSPCLTLIDGQQRMTTLFLLLWYFAASSGCPDICKDFKKHLLKDEVCRFSYITRDEDREFCKLLVSLVDNVVFQIDPELGIMLNASPLSRAIVNQKDFSIYWSNDPTISAMLVMLDTIQERFPAKNGSEYYKRLKENVSVDMLNLKNLDATDAGELYIKMNSRGKPLTRFENFKAKLLGFVRKLGALPTDLIEEVDSGLDEKVRSALKPVERLGWLLDVRWTEAAWKAVRTNEKNDNDSDISEESDQFLLSLFVLPVMNISSCIKRKEGGEVDLFYLKSALRLPYEAFTNALGNGEDACRLISSLVRFLNNVTHPLQAGGWQFSWPLPDRFRNSFPYFNRTAYKNDVFDKLKADEEPTYENLLNFHDCYCYLSVNPVESEEQKEHFSQWIRFIRNIISNRTYSEKDYVPALESIDKLCHQFVRNEWSVEEGFGYPGLNSQQIEEEFLKLNLMRNGSDEWKISITNWEVRLYPYFSGQLHYAFEYAEVTKPSEATDAALVRFNRACQVMDVLFCQKNLLRYQQLLTSILIVDGNYMDFFPGDERDCCYFRRSWQRYSLLCPSDRDFSWKRFLCDVDQGRQRGRQSFTKLITDNPAFRFDDVATSLDGILASEIQDAGSLPRWKRILATNPDIFGTVRFSESAKGQIWNSQRSFYVIEDVPELVWLFPLDEKKSRISSFHKELYSLDLYTRLARHNDIREYLYYREDSTADGLPMVRLFTGQIDGPILDAWTHPNNIDEVTIYVHTDEEENWGPSKTGREANTLEDFILMFADGNPCHKDCPYDDAEELICEIWKELLSVSQ